MLPSSPSCTPTAKVETNQLVYSANYPTGFHMIFKNS